MPGLRLEDQGNPRETARPLAPEGDSVESYAHVAPIMTITLDTRLTPSPDTICRELDGEAVILHLESGQYYGLDAIGTRIWALIPDHPRPRDIAAVLVGEYDVRPRQLEADLLDLLTRLAERSLIHVDS